MRLLFLSLLISSTVHAFSPLFIATKRWPDLHSRKEQRPQYKPLFASSGEDDLTIDQQPTPTTNKEEYKPYDGEDDDEDDVDAYDVYWLDAQAEDEYYNDESILLGEKIGQGQAVVCIPHVATAEDCQYMYSCVFQAAERRGGPAVRGRSRFSASDPDSFDSELVLKCDEILSRVMDYIDENIPSIYDVLFLPSEDWVSQQPLDANLDPRTVPPEPHLADMCDGLREMYMMSELEFSEGEPALNLYESGGEFGCHKDHLALTVLMPLTAPLTDFSGGGTGFWAGNRETSENPMNPPSLVLKPPPGSALIFGGDVTHAGMPVKDGYRSVFVCSFSTKTPASPPDRLHGLHAPPKVSPNFKGSM